MGGALTDNLTWRWCFYINLPLGGMVLVGTAIFFKPVAPVPALIYLPRNQKLRQLDLFGTILFITAISCLFIALQWGGVKYPWFSGRIVILCFVFGLAGIAWIYIQYCRGETATLPGRVIAQRSIASGAISSFCMGGAFFILLYYVAIWLQAVKGKSAIQSGISSLPMILGLTIGIAIAGQTQQYLNYIPPYMIISAILACTGCGLFLTWTPQTSPRAWIGYQALFGLGQGVGWQQPFSIVQSSLANRDLPVGTALMSGCKLLGGAVFVSVASSLFSQRLQENLTALGAGIDASALIRAGAAGFRDDVAPDLLPQVVEAYNEALRHIFAVSVCLSCVAVLGALGTEWKPIAETKKRRVMDS